MKRRSFFSRIAGLVAAVAIAPEIAFRTKLPLPKWGQQETIVAFWTQTDRAAGSYDAEYLKTIGLTYKANLPGPIPWPIRRDEP